MTFDWNAGDGCVCDCAVEYKRNATKGICTCNLINVTTARGVGVWYTQKQIELPILHSYYMHNGYLSSYSVQRK